MKRKTLALIGCGGRSKGHMEAFDACADLFDVIGCADPMEKAQKRWKDHYPDKPLYNSTAELYAKQIPDVVAICTKEQPRYALTMEAIGAGVKGIVLEKPMARNVDQAREMTAAAAAKGIPMAVSHQMRFCDEFVKARDAIRAGEIGPAYYARASSFGHLMEQGPHMVDMILYLLDDPEVDWVMGSVADIEAGRSTVHPAPAFVVGYIAFKNGQRAVVECGREFQKALTVPADQTWMQKRVQVLGVDGIADVIVCHYGRIMNKSGGWRTLAEGWNGWNNATIGLYRELYEVMTRGGEHRNSAAVSLRGFEIIHGIYQSVLTRERVTLPIPAGAAPLETIMAAPPKPRP